MMNMRTNSQHSCWYHKIPMYLWLYSSLHNIHVIRSATLTMSNSLIKFALAQSWSFNLKNKIILKNIALRRKNKTILKSKQIESRIDNKIRKTNEKYTENMWISLI